MYFYFVKEGALVPEREIKNISVSPYDYEHPEEFGVEFLFANSNGGMFGKFSKDGAAEYLDWLADQIGMGSTIMHIDLKFEGGHKW